MAVRTCKVSCRNPEGVEHTVEVGAQSVFEAVAQALRVFREYEWGCDLALAASVLVRIRQPEVEHRVQIRFFYNWLEAAGRSPAEMALKSRLRDILSKWLFAESSGCAIAPRPMQKAGHKNQLSTISYKMSQVTPGASDMNQMDFLELAVRDALARMCGPDPRAPDLPKLDWHEETIRTIGEVAREAGHLWLPDRSANLSGWLWDGVALEQGSSRNMYSGDLTGIALALEVEFSGFGNVLYDLKKLIVARTAHRVLVSATRVNRSGAEDCAKQLKNVIDRFQQ